MPHLDDGTLHAWLDQGRSGMDSDRVAEVERHLAECEVCRERLEEARDLTLRAKSVLSSADPLDTDVPDFSAVLARAGAAADGVTDGIPADEAGDGFDSRRPTRRGWIPLAWAASVAGAIGIGWLTNDMMGPEQVAFQTSTPAERTAAADEVAASSPPPAGAEPAVVAESGPAFGARTSEPEAPPPAARELGAAQTAVEAEATRALDEAFVAGDSGRVAQRALGNSVPRVAPPELRDAPPEPSPPWTPATVAEAVARVGFTPLIVPELEVLTIETGPFDGQTVVRVAQVLDTGVLLVTQRRDSTQVADAIEAPAEADGFSTVSVRSGDLVVTGTAPLPADSLRALLEEAR